MQVIVSGNGFDPQDLIAMGVMVIAWLAVSWFKKINNLDANPPKPYREPRLEMAELENANRVENFLKKIREHEPLSTTEKFEEIEQIRQLAPAVILEEEITTPYSAKSPRPDFTSRKSLRQAVKMAVVLEKKYG